MPRILIAPQEFKGSLTAKGAAEAIAAGLRRALPSVELDLLPMADGGPGTLDALVDATGGRLSVTSVHDPLGRVRRARWGRLPDGTAVIEMAEASGLVLLRADERDPRRASTFGTGELLCAALDAGCRRVIVGVGGSATNDGGAGAAQALGARLLDTNNSELPPGGSALSRLDRIDASALAPRLRDCDVVVATDVTNALCGQEGASVVYGPQKGADESAVRELDAALEHFAEIVKRDLRVDAANVPGAGAAGGLAYGLIVFCAAEVRSGFDVVADAVRFADRVARSDVVVTGEGRLDRQSGFGKTTAGVARVAHEHNKPVIVIAGSIVGGGQSEATQAFDRAFALGPEGAPAPSITQAGELLEKTAGEAGRWLAGSGLLG